MKVETIIKELDLEFPRTLAMDWDNPGLQVGSSQKEVKKVLVALDATNEVIEECIAWHADLLLTHHRFCSPASVRSMTGLCMEEKY